jgi:hypothetical protein
MRTLLLSPNFDTYLSVNKNILLVMSRVKPRYVTVGDGSNWDLPGWHNIPNNLNRHTILSLI